GTWTDEFTIVPNIIALSIATDGSGNAWFAGDDASSSPPSGVIYKRNAGGSPAWQKQTTPAADHMFQDLAFFDSNHGWAIGSGSGPVIAATSDGGATWTNQALPPPPSGQNVILF